MQHADHTREALHLLTVARTRLVLERPFLGALALYLPLVSRPASQCRTTATDGQALYFNGAYIITLASDQIEFMMAHETLHCALAHLYRRAGRDRERWDLACDYAVNPILLAEGLQPTAEALYETAYEGLAAEEIYPLLTRDNQQQTQDQHWYPNSGGSEDCDPLASQMSSAESSNQQIMRWQQRLASSAATARQAGQIGPGWSRLVQFGLRPQVSWRAVLAGCLSYCGRDDYSFARPSRREGDMMLPALHSAVTDLVVVVDISGSISDQEIAEFFAEIDAIKGQIRTRVRLLACDDKLSDDSPQIFQPWQQMILPKGFFGGGSTDFRPPFDWLEHQDLQPAAAIYFTDAQGTFPESEPDIPVFWLVKGHAPVPWGQRIQLN